MRHATACGAWEANFGETKQALAPVLAKTGRYLRLSRKERSPCPALSSGFTSLMSKSESTPSANLASPAAVMALKENGPARSYKPGCSIKIPAGKPRVLNRDAK